MNNKDKKTNKQQKNKSIKKKKLKLNKKKQQINKYIIYFTVRVRYNIIMKTSDCTCTTEHTTNTYSTFMCNIHRRL